MAKKKWIQDMHMKKGSLRATAKAKGLIHGNQPVTESVLNTLEHSKNKKTRKRANLAETLMHLR